MTRLALIDDHALFRESLARLLEGEEDLTVSGHYSSLEQAQSAIDLTGIDVVLLDIDLPGARGGNFLEWAEEQMYTGVKAAIQRLF